MVSFPLKCMSGLFQVFTAVLWLFNMVCWAAKGIPPAGGDETSIQKLNIHEKLNYQNDKRKMLEVLKNPGDYTQSLYDISCIAETMKYYQRNLGPSPVTFLSLLGDSCLFIG